MGQSSRIAVPLRRSAALILALAPGACSGRDVAHEDGTTMTAGDSGAVTPGETAAHDAAIGTLRDDAPASAARGDSEAFAASGDGGSCPVLNQATDYSPGLPASMNWTNERLAVSAVDGARWTLQHGTDSPLQLDFTAIGAPAIVQVGDVLRGSTVISCQPFSGCETFTVLRRDDMTLLYVAWHRTPERLSEAAVTALLPELVLKTATVQVCRGPTQGCYMNETDRELALDVSLAGDVGGAPLRLRSGDSRELTIGQHRYRATLVYAVAYAGDGPQCTDELYWSGIVHFRITPMMT